MLRFVDQKTTFAHIRKSLDSMCRHGEVVIKTVVTANLTNDSSTSLRSVNDNVQAVIESTGHPNKRLPIY